MLDGGPTLNPSTYDLLAAIHAVGPTQVVVLPNSANVVMAAEHAAAAVGEDRPRRPSQSQQAGLAAAVSLDPQRAASENAAAMSEALERIRTGAVAPRRATTPEAASARATRSASSGEELFAWGEPSRRCERVLAELGAGCELVT